MATLAAQRQRDRRERERAGLMVMADYPGKSNQGAGRRYLAGS
jgi:hypothetical protein